MKRLIGVLAVGAVLAAGGIYFWDSIGRHRTVQQLLAENRYLQEALSNLAFEQQIGYAKVLEQVQRNGCLFTKILLVQTLPEDTSERVFRHVDYPLSQSISYGRAGKGDRSVAAAVRGKDAPGRGSGD